MESESPSARQALTVLSRLGEREQDVHPWLYRLIAGDPDGMLPAAVEVAMESGEAIPMTPNAITRVINEVLVSEDVSAATLRRIRDLVHPETASLVKTHAIATSRLLATDDDLDADEAMRLRVEYAERLFEAGHRKVALRNIRRTVRRARRSSHLQTADGIETLRVLSALQQANGMHRRSIRTAKRGMKLAFRMAESGDTDPSQGLRMLVALGLRFQRSRRGREAETIFRLAIEIAEEAIEGLTRENSENFAAELLVHQSPSGGDNSLDDGEFTDADVAAIFRGLRGAAERSRAFAQVGLAEVLNDRSDPEAIYWAERALRYFDGLHADTEDQHSAHVSTCIYLASEAFQRISEVPEGLHEFSIEVEGRIESALWDLLQHSIARDNETSILAGFGRILLRHQDDDVDARREFCEKLNKFGLALRHDDRPVASAQILSIAVELFSDPDPTTESDLRLLAALHASLSQAFDDLGDKLALVNARLACERAEQACLVTHQDGSTDEANCAVSLGSVYNGLSIRLESRGKLKDALEAQLRSAKEYERCYTPERQDLVFAANVTMHRLLYLAGEVDELERVIEEIHNFASHLVDTYPGHREDLGDVIADIGEHLGSHEAH